MNNDKYLPAIIAILKEEGLELQMEAIARRIGVTKKTLYNRFSSKDKMIEDCLEMVSAQFRESLSCMDEQSIPVEKRFEMGVSALRQYFKDMSHAFMRDMMKLYPQMASRGHSMGLSFFEEKIAANIEEGKREGVYRQDADSQLLSRYISFSIFSFFQKRVMLGNDFSAAYYFEQVIKFNINALIVKQ